MFVLVLLLLPIIIIIVDETFFYFLPARITTTVVFVLGTRMRTAPSQYPHFNMIVILFGFAKRRIFSAVYKVFSSQLIFVVVLEAMPMKNTSKEILGEKGGVVHCSLTLIGNSVIHGCIQDIGPLPTMFCL